MVFVTPVIESNGNYDLDKYVGINRPRKLKTIRKQPVDLKWPQKGETQINGKFYHTVEDEKIL